ncbi:hypothetical protein GCM10022251_39620 [Phytohabitans flavus]|uniref:hypothetical protein n=2 Tax=Phytohabitans flavus TaxID=1076124 RepID=UPI0031E5B7B6
MRHAGSLLLSLFLAPLIWIATGYGLNEVNRARVQLSDGFQVEIVLGLLALLVAGGMYALLTMARLSPIGPALIGLVFFVLAAWAAFDPRSYFDTMPTDLRDGDLALTYPSLGYSAMLAVPLLATLLSPRRWRRHPHPAAAMPAGVPPYPMPAAGMPPGAVPPGGAYPLHYGQPATQGYPTPPPLPGAPYLGAPVPGAPQPARFGAPAPTAPIPVTPPTPMSAPPMSAPPMSAPPMSAAPMAAPVPPTSAPPAPVSMPPVDAPTTRIPSPVAEHETTTRLSQPPAPPLDGPTTRIPTSPTTAVPSVTPPRPPVEEQTTRIQSSPTTAPRAVSSPDDQTTTLIGAGDTEATQMLKGPPPKDAYPRPAWSAPTPPPITPPGARRPDDDLDDPEATQPAR